MTPFVFSALSRQSLYESLAEYANFIESNQSLNLRDLAYTLQQRRTAFPYRISFAADSAENLVIKIRAELEGIKVEDLGVRLSPPTEGKRPKVIGIFTGQGKPPRIESIFQALGRT